MSGNNVTSNNLELFNRVICIELKVTGIFLSILVIAIVSSNSTLIWTIIRNKKLHTPINYLNLFLAIDHLVCALVFVTSYAASSLICKSYYEQLGCNILGVVICYTISAANYTLMLISIERFLVICRPFKDFSLNIPRCKIAIMIIFVMSLMVSILPVVGWSQYAYSVGNVLCWIVEDLTNPNALLFWLFIIVFLYCIPLMTLGYTNTRSVLTIRNSSKKFENDKVEKKKIRKESRLLKIAIYSIVAFLISYTPYIITTIMKIFMSDSYTLLIYSAFLAITQIASLWPSLVNLTINRDIRYCIFKKDEKKSSKYEDKSNSSATKK